MARILLVDDEPDILAMLEQMVRRLGHESCKAANGLEALRQLEKGAVDVVITDLIMPESEGLETITAVRKRWPGIRIIAISGGGRRAPGPYLAVAANMGADATLAKPFEWEDLAATLRHVLAMARPTSSPAGRS